MSKDDTAKKDRLKAERGRQLMRDAVELEKIRKHFGLTMEQMLQISALINEFNEENNSCPYCHQPMPGTK